ncbi:MAG: M24 family metallopeptidase, partial [Alistipes sp.]|nr:M24 family metallopeptidase [Alistipes sp.]
ATCIYRKAWRLMPGTVLSDEPGLYFIPALIEKCKSEGLYTGIVDYDRLASYYNFGGIRIEDDLIVTDTGCRMIGRDKHIPITIEELETIIGK